MAIHMAHPIWAFYAGQIPGWRMQAALDYANVTAVLGMLNWQPVIAQVIGGVNVNFHVGLAAADENHPNDKMRGVRRAIERIQAVRPALAIPNMEVYITRHRHGPIPLGGGVAPPLQTVASHVNAAGANQATIVLTGSSILPNPLQGAVPGVPALTCRGRTFRAAQGTRGPRGIADYWQETRRARKRSNRIAAITIHELGHVLHQLANPGRFWPLNCAAADYTMAPNRKLNISLYANTSLCEFVAENFTARILGCTIANAGIINIDYNTLGGAW